MGQQIIRQPDGQYALWSSVVDSFVLIDADPEGIIEYWIEQEEKRLRERVAEIVASLEAGGKPYHQFTMSWHEALARHEQVHGSPFDLEAERTRPPVESNHG